MTELQGEMLGEIQGGLGIGTGSGRTLKSLIRRGLVVWVDEGEYEITEAGEAAYEKCYKRWVAKDKKAEPGRPRIYENAAEKQAAYRKRKAEADETDNFGKLAAQLHTWVQCAMQSESRTATAVIGADSRETLINVTDWFRKETFKNHDNREIVDVFNNAIANL